MRGDYFVPGASEDVDVVVADRYGGRHAQPRRRLEQLLVDFFGEQADQRFFIGNALQELCASNALWLLPVFDLEMLVEDRPRRRKKRASRKSFRLAHRIPRITRPSRAGEVVYAGERANARRRESGRGGCSFSAHDRALRALTVVVAGGYSVVKRRRGQTRATPNGFATSPRS